MTRDPVVYLEDMLTYAREAHEFAQGTTTEAFNSDTRRRYAVTYALQIVGEAAGNVPS